MNDDFTVHGERSYIEGGASPPPSVPKAKRIRPQTFAQQESVSGLSHDVLARASEIAKRLGEVNNVLLAKTAPLAENIIARWRGDVLDIKTIDNESNAFEKIAFRIKKTFLHDKGWKERLINDIDYLNKTLPEGDHKREIIQIALPLARNIIQTGGFFASPSSIAVDRLFRNICNQWIAHSDISPDDHFKSQFIEYQMDKSPKEVDFEHALGATIATSVGGKLGKGGLSCWTSTREVETLNDLVEAGGKLPDTVDPYLRAAKKCLPLNRLIELAQLKSISKDASYFYNIARDFKKMIDDLDFNDKEFVFMDSKYPGHSMRTVFSKDEDGYIQARLFDTSGDIESLEGNFFTSTLRELLGSKQRVCLDVTIHPDKFRDEGQAWLEQLVSMNSRETHEKMKHLDSTQLSNAFRRVFCSIAFVKVIAAEDYSQTAENCYAKRLEAAQLDLLGAQGFLQLRLKQYDQLEGKIKAIIGIESFEEPKEMKRSEYNRVRNALRRLKNKDILKSPEVHGRNLWKMYQHDRAVIKKELDRLS